MQDKAAGKTAEVQRPRLLLAELRSFRNPYEPLAHWNVLNKDVTLGWRPEERR